MYLIRVEMDRHLSEVRRAIADCQKMHTLVTGLFGTARQDSQILYRSALSRDGLRLYLYASQPVKDQWRKQYDIVQRDITPWLEGLEAGQIWNFDLTASPSKKVPAEGKRHSQRRILRQPGERQEWLARKAAQSGFVILQATELEQLHISGTHSMESGGKMYHDAYHYQGVLQITDADAFRRALQIGIGSGKAYGFGMMLLKE